MANRPTPISIKFGSERCFRLAQMCWEWVMLSLFLDLAVIKFGHGLTNSSYDTCLLATICVGIGLIGLFREIIRSTSQHFHKLREKLLERYSLILVGLGVLITLVEAGIHISAANSLIVVVIIAALAIPVGYSTLKAFNSMRQSGLINLHDNLNRVERGNIFSLVLTIGPAIFARLAALLAAIAATATTEQLATYLPIGAASCLILIALKPDQNFFRGPCKKCQRITSRALDDIGYCPNCAPDKFQQGVEQIPSNLNSLKIWNIIQSAFKRA